MQNPGEYMIRRSNIERYNLLHEFFHAWFDIRRRAGMVGDRDSQRKVTKLRPPTQCAVFIYVIISSSVVCMFLLVYEGVHQLRQGVEL